MNWAQVVAAVKSSPGVWLLALGFFLLPVSNAAGQVPLYLVSVGWCIAAFRRKMGCPRRASALFLGGMAVLILASWPIAAFVAETSTARVVGKLNRLLLFPLVFAIPGVCGRGEARFRNLAVLMAAFVAGTGVLALYDLVRVPLEMRSGTPLFHTGNMASPQIYMVALFLTLGLRTSGGGLKHRLLFVACAGVAVVGMLLHNKRGVWLACMLAAGGWVVWTRQWRVLVAMVLLGVAAVSLPSVRMRLSELREVVQPTHGGRMVLWREVAPRILPQYPWGMGYNVTTYEDFREVLPDNIHLEVGLRHLHNNLLQIRLELGWQGLVWWMAWMGWAVFIALRPAPPEGRLLRSGVSFALCGLLANGLVVYNFGTTESFMMYMSLLGMLDVFVYDQSQPPITETLT